MSLTLLLIEADRHTQRNVTGLLEAEGHVVISEPAADWAMRIFEKRFFQAILLGKPAGALDSLQMAERIRSTIRGKSMPLIMLAGAEMSSVVRRKAKEQYDLHDILDKPVKPPRLLLALKNLGSKKPPTAKPHVEPREQRVEDYAGPESRKEREEVERDAGQFAGASWQGKLEEVPLPQLLGNLHQLEADGVLLIKRERKKKLITLFKGDPVFIKSNNLGECLGRLLVRAGMISDEECNRSLEIMRETGQRQGPVLLEMGLISPNSLRRALEKQFRLKLFDLFGWHKGAFMFKPESRDDIAPPPTQATTAELILAGIEKQWSLERIEKSLKDKMDAYLVANRDPLLRFQNMNIDENAERFVATLQGGQSIGDVLAGAADRVRVARLIFALLSTGMFQAIEDPIAPDWEEDEVTAEITDESAVLAHSVDPGLVPDLSGELEADIQRPTSGLTNVREALALQIQKVQEADLHSRLGVPRNASKTRITKAFFEKARKYHPDRQDNRESTQVRRLSVQLFKSFCDAHDVLIDDEKRKAYEQQHTNPAEIAAQTTAAPQKTADAPSQRKADANLASQALRAEELFRLGKTALQRGDTQSAVKQLSAAVKLCPDEGEYLAELGLATLRRQPKDESAQEEARDHLNQAVSLSPRLDLAHLYLGYVYRAMGQSMMAFSEFEKAVECNPYCTEAMREIRLTRMRHKPKKKSKGLFGRKK